MYLVVTTNNDDFYGDCMVYDKSWNETLSLILMATDNDFCFPLKLF